MVYVEQMDDEERRRLKLMARREVGRVSERIRMVLLSSRGYTVGQIAAVFEVDEAAVRDWLCRYKATGVEGLKDRPRSGRPRKVDAAAREELRLRV
ncbi:MAG: helix-turn-helix domain-containing protein, partial [Chloroflexia bacterium]